MDKIYWYNGFSGIAEKTNIIINRVERIETKDLEPGLWRNIYKVHYRASNLGEFIMWIGTKGTGIELNGVERYIIDDSGELDIIGIKKYLHNREMSEVIDKLGPNCDPKIIKETSRGFHFLKEQNITLYDEDFFISASMNYLKSTILPLEYTDKMVKSLQILLHNMWVGQVLNKLK